MIVFTAVAAPEAAKAAVRPPKNHPHNARLAEQEQELLQVRAEARATHEEMQTSQEEFRSASEELRSTNEELQSTNEELTTSKEDMQSLNEELQTLNTELQVKVDELSRSSNDMKNLLNSTDIATLFLDNDLNVRRFTPQATNIIKLIPADVGRPITDLSSDLRYPELAEDALEVLRTLAPAEKPITARDGRWFTVRIMPYRTLDDRIDGVVITFADITVAKTLEAELRKTQAGLEKRVTDQATKDGTTGRGEVTPCQLVRHRASQQHFTGLILGQNLVNCFDEFSFLGAGCGLGYRSVHGASKVYLSGGKECSSRGQRLWDVTVSHAHSSQTQSDRTPESNTCFAPARIRRWLCEWHDLGEHQPHRAISNQ